MSDNITPRVVNGPDDLPAMCLVPEVAQFFRQTDKVIRKWIGDGRFPNAYKEGKAFLIPKEDVINYAEQKYGQR